MKRSLSEYVIIPGVIALVELVIYYVSNDIIFAITFLAFSIIFINAYHYNLYKKDNIELLNNYLRKYVDIQDIKPIFDDIEFCKRKYLERTDIFVNDFKKKIANLKDGIICLNHRDEYISFLIDQFNNIDNDKTIHIGLNNYRDNKFPASVFKNDARFKKFIIAKGEACRKGTVIFTIFVGNPNDGDINYVIKEHKKIGSHCLSCTNIHPKLQDKQCSLFLRLNKKINKDGILIDNLKSYDINFEESVGYIERNINVHETFEGGKINNTDKIKEIFEFVKSSLIHCVWIDQNNKTELSNAWER